MGNELCGYPAIGDVKEVSMKWGMPTRERLSCLMEGAEGERSTDPEVDPDK